VAPRLFLVGAALFAATAIPATADPPSIVAVAGFRFQVPAPGRGIGAEALLARGGERRAEVRTLRDGRVVISSHVWRPRRGVAPPGTPFDKCRDGGYALSSSWWRRTYEWRFRARSTPAGTKRFTALVALRRAVTTITHGSNHCGLRDEIDATSNYVGRTRRRGNIDANSDCTSPDGTNTVSFGRISPKDLSLTCWWTVGNHSVEADIVFNKADYSWTTHWQSGCTDSWSLRDIATHEFGHAFGLAHVNPLLHPNQTMTPVIRPCQNSQASLGRGDVLGLRAKY
jgi:Matrixin